MAEPPTRLQRPGRATAAAHPGATRIQSAPRQPGATRIQSAPRKATAAGTDPSRFIPAELRERFVIGELLGSGGEATVWLAHAADELGVPVALKVYRPGVAFDEDLRRRLDKPEWRRYVPRLYAYGVARPADGIEVGWEAMEYFPLGTLADLVDREAPRGGTLHADRLRAIVAELTDAFDFWEHTIQRRQTDVSPGNILIRSDGPSPEFVLGDFGGVLSTGVSKRFADLMAKAAYMSPEALAGLNDPRGPYWSLGAICFELLTGRPMYGEDLTEDTIRVALVFDEPDVDELPEQWQDLVAGLLTRRPEDRWGAEEVRGWLAGGKVPVRRRASGAARLPVTFASTPYTDPVALAAAMVDASDDAAAWLSGAGAARLGEWLADEMGDNRFDRRVLADVAGDLVSAHVAVAAFAATYLPNLPPRYRGAAVTVERLRTLAGDPARHPLLVEVIRRGVLPYAARHRCDHPDCAVAAATPPGPGTSAAAGAPGDGCRRLAAIGRLVPRAVTIAMTGLATLSSECGSQNALRSASIDPAGGRVLTPDIERNVCAQAVLLATGPEAVRTRRLGLRLMLRPDEPWWQLRRRAALTAEPGTEDGLAALVVAEVLRPFAKAYQRALSNERRVGDHEPAGGRRGAGTRLRALAARAGIRLDSRAGQRTWPWLGVVLFATLEALGLAPVVRSWPPGEPELSAPIWQGVAWLKSHAPDFVTTASDPLGAWIVAVLPESTRWLGPVAVAAVVVVCLALARKTDGGGAGARLVRVVAALAGRAVMAAYLLHLAVWVLDPVAVGVTATMPWLVVGLGIAVALVFRWLTGGPRTTTTATSPWPIRLAVGGGLLALTVILLQHAPLPDAAAKPSASQARSAPATATTRSAA
ncbi:hypothetical protein V6U89_26275 [Micromonospora sp. CPCC 206171]|uniref:protein kinase domain-containing protein n=1 Tax=Micromonospora sp. CPCC 206171 TaxID=3122405 RepID=UPI002FF165FF